jgi:hypothetical protein
MRRVRLIGSASVLTLVAVLAVGSASATPEGTASTAVRICGAGDLRPGWGPVAGTAGTEGAALRFTNVSARACAVRGYLTLWRLNAAKRVMTTRVHRGGSLNGVFPDPGPSRIVLRPGKKTSAEITWRDTSTSGQACRRSFYLRVTLPRESAHLLARTGRSSGPGLNNAISACGGHLTLTALQRGAKPAKPGPITPPSVG